MPLLTKHPPMDPKDSRSTAFGWRWKLGPSRDTFFLAAGLAAPRLAVRPGGDRTRKRRTGPPSA